LFKVSYVYGVYGGFKIDNDKYKHLLDDEMKIEHKLNRIIEILKYNVLQKVKTKNPQSLQNFITVRMLLIPNTLSYGIYLKVIVTCNWHKIRV
jgi:hypothetical protein